MIRRKQAFAPLVAPATRVLILGSLPGDASLAAQQYYANPRNRFWHLIGAVIGRPDLPGLGYDARLGVLLAAGIGLWDAVASAERPGSLDSAIRQAEPAALAELAATLPLLRAVGCNGQASASLARKLLAGTGQALIELPSSSPAHAAMPYPAKLEHWLALKEFLPAPLPCAPNGGIPAR